MDTLHFFLEGPGRETIAVTPFSCEEYEPSGSPPAHRAMIDDTGNIARQTDKNGYRYEFSNRFGVWSLIVAD